MAGFLVAAAVVIGLIFLKKRSQTRAVSDTPSSEPDIQFVRHTLTSTEDETPVSYHDSFTYDGGLPLISSNVAPLLTGTDRSAITLPLI
jgi:hypothetical protein